MSLKKINPQKLGHLVLSVRDIHKSVDFYTNILGLKVSDWISDQMVFLRSGTDHHDLALAQIPKDSAEINDLPRYSRPGLEHFSYLVESLEDINDAVYFLKENQIEIVRGIGKHGPGQNCFLVFKDPDGNNVELYCEMEQIPHEKPRDPEVWVKNIQSFDQWNFEKLVVPPPASMLKEKNTTSI